MDFSDPLNAAPRPKAHAALLPIREIGPRHRAQLAEHLLALPAHDRYLRFGYAAGDEQIRQYVAQLDFAHDTLFGIFNRKLALIATAHLAYPRQPGPVQEAEFGVCVAPHARGRGYGARLFERAALHAVNDGVHLLYINALSENTAMLRIARTAGAVIERYGSESQARLRLPEASFASRLSERLAGQWGQVNYWLKSEASRARGALASVQGKRQAQPLAVPDTHDSSR